jgi:hypothetical protein
MFDKERDVRARGYGGKNASGGRRRYSRSRLLAVSRSSILFHKLGVGPKWAVLWKRIRYQESAPSHAIAAASAEISGRRSPRPSRW